MEPNVRRGKMLDWASEKGRVSVNKKEKVTQDKHGYYSLSLLGRVRRKNSIATRKKLAFCYKRLVRATCKPQVNRATCRRGSNIIPLFVNEGLARSPVRGCKKFTLVHRVFPLLKEKKFVEKQIVQIGLLYTKTLAHAQLPDHFLLKIFK